MCIHITESLCCMPKINTTLLIDHQFSSVTHVRLFATPWTAEYQASLSKSPTHGVYSNSCPLSQWCHPTISSSVIPLSHLQSFPASGSFPMSQFFASCSQSIGVSALASFLPKNTQDWFHLEWTGWISLQSKGLSRVFTNTTVQKHKFFSAQLSLESNSHVHTEDVDVSGLGRVPGTSHQEKGPWLGAGKTSRASHSKVKAGLLREIHIP